jgi:hypothetical protein
MDAASATDPLQRLPGSAFINACQAWVPHTEDEHLPGTVTVSSVC